MDKINVVIAIPTYNEKDNIESIVQRCRTSIPQADILIVDDNSPDGTGDIADSLAKDDSKVHVMHREGKNGLGRAYIAAFSWATENGYTHVVEMDADGSHHPEQLPLLLERAAMSDQPDLVIGSRYVEGGKIDGWSKRRQMLSRFGNMYIKLMLGIKTRDVTAGYRVYRLDALKKIDLDTVDTVGYYFQADMTDRLNTAGGRIVEMPITFTERESGESKLSGSVFTESLKKTTVTGVKRRSNQVLQAVNSLKKNRKKDV
ncbi:polyprenol monophosphomannose synthase [Actinotignum urinale]|uniref:Polyprenol monophosphomannose synthase n=1 Tax=Actinotignum urinale TaxID=190146 RepID=A0AAW9HP74_9ACTO|nr:polyprenol monophosphomannose synthase [Actinotignum urinale]MDY5128843.1 polyprenol monophosphomannose synthase [Actinotignum urinale]MDY5133057.1 polyprenol monophosphomannose synthase [Actinotignum urinale]MDY5154532.1 polyprenol monophosphomannose synthase [Actinotignum urinale]MDY5160268.1 polyprenol monophosphomannose synthase [Actinotignum urinale]